MAGRKSQALENNKILFLDSLIPATDILKISLLIDLDSDKRAYITAKPGYDSKVRLYDHLIKVIDERDYWDKLIEYLKSSHRDSVVNALVEGLFASGASSAAKASSGSVLATFANHLANYYMSSNFDIIPTISGAQKHLNKIWVPLRLEDITIKLSEQDSFDQAKMLKCLQNSDVTNVAVIKGDPGMGKSTLVKKIAWDWAEKYSRNPVADNHFSLVLAIPLRSVGKCKSFVELALHYFIDILKFSEVFDMSEPDKSDLYKAVKNLGTKLLICFDGLDEYGSYGESPLRDLFAPPFSPSNINSKVPAPIVLHKIIITSRPYACETVNKDFLPLKFEICPLDNESLPEFIRNYCQKEEGIQKVTDYLQNQRKLGDDRIMIQVPLILMFVCYLADLKKEIPANLSLLYESLTEHMLKREHSEGKLEEKVIIKKWKDSIVIKATGRLAFGGFKAAINRQINSKNSDEDGNALEFDEEYLKENEVTDDSFVCGFLLHKYDSREGCLKAEFLHPSIQEFFAALYCHQLMVQGWELDRNVIVRKILEEDSQFGRFLLGIVSKEKKFGEMVKWLNISIGDVLNRDLNSFFSTVSRSLSDTSEEEQFKLGRHLTGPSLAILEKTIFETNAYGLFQSFKMIVEPKKFAAGLNLNLLEKNVDQTFSWYVTSVQKPRIAKLVVLTNCSIEKLVGKFDKIEILVWLGEPIDQDWVSLCKGLPQILSLWIEMEDEPEFAVSFRVQSSSTAVTTLQKLKIGWTSSEVHWANKLISLFEISFITVGETFESNPVNLDKSDDEDSDDGDEEDSDYDDKEDIKLEKKMKEGFWISNVSVNKTVLQEDLIASLIKLALLIRKGKMGKAVVEYFVPIGPQVAQMPSVVQGFLNRLSNISKI